MYSLVNKCIICGLLYTLPLFSTIAKDRVYQLPSLDHGGGLFHNFMNVIGFLDYCEHNQIINYMVDFEDKGHYYEKDLGLNWWHYFFEPISYQSNMTYLINKVRPRYKKISQSLMEQFTTNVEYKLPAQRCHELIQKHIRIKPHIQSRANEFANQHFQAKFVIGVHYRETDKMATLEGCAEQEATFVSYQDTYKAIEKLLKEVKQTDYAIFVATDSADFLKDIKNHYPHKVIATSSIRSEDGRPIHYNVKSSVPNYYYVQGTEAVIDCLLLSKCNFLIRTSSNLSLCAIFFNPELPHIELNDRL